MLLPKTISEPEVDPGLLTILIYAFPGAGKSTFCSRAEGVVIVQLEPRLKGIRAAKTDLVTAWEDLWKIYHEMKAGNHPFKTVAIDDVGNAYRLCCEKFMREAGVKHESEMGEYGRGYGMINREFYRLVKAFAGLPYGLIMTSHTKEIEMKTKTEKYTRVVADLPDKPRGGIIGLCDYVLFGDKIEVEKRDKENKPVLDDDGKPSIEEVHILRTKWNKTYDAKDGYSALPDVIRLSYPAFLKAFREGIVGNKMFQESAAKGGSGLGMAAAKTRETRANGNAGVMSTATATETKEVVKEDEKKNDTLEVGKPNDTDKGVKNAPNNPTTEALIDQPASSITTPPESTEKDKAAEVTTTATAATTKDAKSKK